MNKDIDFEEKHKEDLERLHNLRLLDDDFIVTDFMNCHATAFTGCH